ncbi:Midasin [Labeo rohita]|uniref:Midasin n=1 Tax=Labeo rohita TaxID=84645 RepID=A0ABQ8MMD9_LABRO|nr:Midasin [Labeo rohita]
MGENLEGGSGGGRIPRRMTNRVQGGDNKERSQGDDMSGLEQEEPGATQATAMMTAHVGADRGRSHGGGRADDSRGMTDGGGAGGGGAQGRDGELMNQGDEEDLEGRSEANGAGRR